jgi:hypothetical protein
VQVTIPEVLSNLHTVHHQRNKLSFTKSTLPLRKKERTVKDHKSSSEFKNEKAQTVEQLRDNRNNKAVQSNS